VRVIPAILNAYPFSQKWEGIACYAASTCSFTDSN